MSTFFKHKAPVMDEQPTAPAPPPSTRVSGLTGLQDVADAARGRALAVRARRAAQQAAQRAAVAAAPSPLTAAQQADQVVDAAAAVGARQGGKPVNSTAVYRWWGAAARARYGDAYVLGAWTRAQQAKAKQLLAGYGPALVEAVVGAVLAVAGEVPPTIDTLHAARERTFHAWQATGAVPVLAPAGARSSRPPAAAERRERLKNFDEYSAPTGGAPEVW